MSWSLERFERRRRLQVRRTITFPRFSRACRSPEVATLTRNAWAPRADVRSEVPRALLQLRVLGLGLPQDGDVGVGVFPKGEEIFVGGAGLVLVAGEYVGASKLQMS
jgi:hypothetical protein